MTLAQVRGALTAVSAQERVRLRELLIITRVAQAPTKDVQRFMRSLD